ncbi:SCY1-like protein 2 [Temnothorax americanus]|uniref:SCY1-like protein 2 n=1 Tax=Temnothorax americanus TaxID=1964332 RepID=UPI0040696BEF
MGKQNHPPTTSHHRSTLVKEYELHELEVKYGLLQITEALLFLHGNCKVLHRNICPTSIIITKRGTWKLSGFEFIGESNLIILRFKDRDSNRSLSIFSQY